MPAAEPARAVVPAAPTLAELAAARTSVWPVRGYVVFHVLNALAEVGLFARLATEGEVDAAELARERGLDAEALGAVLRYLDGLGVVADAGGGHWRAAAEVGETDLDLARMFLAYDPLFAQLGDLLGGRKAYGREIRRDPRLDAEASGRICRRFSYPSLVELLRGRRVRRLLDLGCGAGELLVAVARGCPEIEWLCGVDLEPEAVAVAAGRLAEEGLEDRAAVTVGDILALVAGAPLPGEEAAPFDAVVSSAVFHEFDHPSADRLVEALTQVRRRFPSAPLILAETLEQDDAALRATASHLLEHHLFHRLSHQGIARDDRWRAAFTRAGYRLQERRELPPAGVLYVLDGHDPGPDPGSGPPRRMTR